MCKLRDFKYKLRNQRHRFNYLQNSKINLKFGFTDYFMSKSQKSKCSYLFYFNVSFPFLDLKMGKC